MKLEFMLDPEATAVLDSLARSYPGVADRIEADPEFQAMIAASEADIAAGRVVPDEEVDAFLQARRNQPKH